MDENPGLSDQYRKASPWPLFVALGLPIAEIGILFDLFALAVGGLVLFSGSVAGLLEDAGYVDSPWRALAVCGVLLVPVAAALAFSGLALVTRGYAVGAAAVLLIVGAVAGELFVGDGAVPG